jgi:ketopantoate reductase
VGSAESDYLNGEIALQGRLTSVATPVNDLLQSLVHQMVRESRSPGWLSVEGVFDRLES